jgi:protein-S-isoprenylcysteine O-methyltransferase Ste14
MNANDEHGSSGSPSFPDRIFTFLYRIFAYFGLGALFAIFIFGFRHDPEAPTSNYAFNVVLYAIFIFPHLIMTRSWFKKAVWGIPAGHPAERRVYITITVIVWLAVLWFHRPVPGFAFDWPQWTQFVGIVFTLLGALMFFEGVTFAMIDGLLGVPGSVSAYSHGPQTPLFTEGAYAKVRHPQYRAFLAASLSSWLIHPHAGQLFWIVMLAGTFIAFIPVEEAQLLRARGDDYRAYQDKTRWRIIPWIW